MWLLALWALVAITSGLLCSLLESTLFSVRISTLVERAARSGGGARLLDIKRNRIDDAIGAVLIVNTAATTLGTTFAGGAATRLFGDYRVGLISAALVLLMLVISEIVPKTLGASYPRAFSSFAGYALSLLIWITSPLLVVTRALIRLLTRHPPERLTRRELAILVGGAPQEGTLSLTEAALIDNLIFSSEVTVGEVMTPRRLVFMLGCSQTVDDLLGAPSANAFSRIPLYRNNKKSIVGYVVHREVLKAFAIGNNRHRSLESFALPLPHLPASLPVGRALERLMAQHDSIALVTGRADKPAGIVTLEDLLEALLGMDITDEPEAVERLRPAITLARRRRRKELRRRLKGQLPGAE